MTENETYLKLTGRKLGYLLNFGESLMKPVPVCFGRGDGISRIVNGEIE
ncbi:MAG: hypothetical protein SCARUB_04621 [Candidatus Scalindua rubra]|uniref:Uncharacterized protein n=1 Tax=Candidatus Scalindua rubra TaxID=1872076 RepID=A0A1E3X3U2_9BACT|nr:MAG: hypothetical protein SCARUB_04621 [Candidatus Scalindua rubra]